MISPPSSDMLRDFEAVTARGEASGFVRDQNGMPVVGATVKVRTHVFLGDPAQQGIATTDASGAFQWIGLPDGKFRPNVTIHGKEYQPDVFVETGTNDASVVVNLP